MALESAEIPSAYGQLLVEHFQQLVVLLDQPGKLSQIPKEQIQKVNDAPFFSMLQ